MKIKLNFSGISKWLTFRRIAIFIVNIVIIALLAIGIRKLFFSTDQARQAPAVAQDKGTPKDKQPKKQQLDGLTSLFPKASEEKIPIKAYVLTPADFTDELPTSGTVRGIPELDLKFETNGMLQQVNVKEGDSAKRGDVLAVLDAKDVNVEIQWAQAKLQAAESEYKAALARYQIVEKLYQVGAIIKDRLDQVQAEVDVSKAKIEISRKELELSRLKLSKLNLQAPQSGLISKKEKNVGEFITPNDIIFKFIDEENIFVEVGIIEKDIFKIKSGQRVKISVDTYPTRVFFGYVETIFPQLDERTRSLNVRIRVLDPGKLLKPGMFARSSIAVFSKKDALVIPSSSVSIQQGAYYAAVVE
ncbi:MAG TPA: efflux RND transporter periplasmic adaptor subunit, partial [Candidatus Omnitrophica bacterium]|nr:efflux RND transporter periplasmic adaptor subunit [Candidatus Omnitrophota bacterium]